MVGDLFGAAVREPKPKRKAQTARRLRDGHRGGKNEINERHETRTARACEMLHVKCCTFLISFRTEVVRLYIFIERDREARFEILGRPNCVARCVAFACEREATPIKFQDNSLGTDCHLYG